MLRNYLKIAFRNLRRNKGYAFINIIGLAVGMACCFLIFLYVWNELSYDDFHPKADRIYRIIQETEDGGIAWVGGAMSNALKKDFPAIEKIVRLHREDVLLSRSEETASGRPQKFEEPNFFFVDSTFFDVFSFSLAEGNPNTALSRPNTVVLTQERASKYFGDEDPIGQSLILDFYGERPLTVTGVLDEVPDNSHLTFDFLTSLGTFKLAVGYTADYTFTSYWWPHMWTYVLLNEQASARVINKRLPTFIKRYRNPEAAANYIPQLQPLTNIHLHSHLGGEIQANGRMAYVYIFSAIALLILLIACTNFMNLTTARSMERAREVGVRKAVGARRSQLIRQFLGESVLLTLIALVGAVLLVMLLLPVLSNFTGTTLTLDYTSNAVFGIGLIVIVFFTGLLAGSYPAFFLSRFKPAQVLKGSLGGHKVSGIKLRQGLVIFQFTVSIVLISGTAIIFQQLDYLRSASLGFNQEHILTLPVEKNHKTFKAELLQLSKLLAVTSADVRPGFGSGGDPQYETAPFSSVVSALVEQPRMYYQEVGYSFFETMGLEIIAGRAFSKEYPSDEGHLVEKDDQHFSRFIRGRAVVINESAAARLGWTPQEAIGKRLRLFTQESGTLYMDVSGPIVGVVEDYHAAPLRQEIEPIAYMPGGDDYALVKIAPGDPSETIGQIKAVWNEVFPQLPFEVSFLNQDLDNLYRAEQRLLEIFGFFAFLAILISCLGLFGLAANMAEQRTKEIGIRKVLGATVSSIFILLSKDFLKLVGIGFVIAVPIAYFTLHWWLENFAYRIDLGPGVFLLAGLIAIGIALATVSYQSIKAALANPADSLRYE